MELMVNPNLRYNMYLRDIITGIVIDPVEDGKTHSYEKVINMIIKDCGANSLFSLLNDLNHIGNHHVVSILKLISRVENLDSEVCVLILSKYLFHNDLEIQDAALQAAELWNNPSTISVLRKYQNNFICIQDYLEKVICNITESNKNNG